MSNLDTGLRVRPNKYTHSDLEFPKMAKPQIVGYFSVTTNGDYEQGARNLRYYKQPKKFPFDLNEGYEYRIENPETANSKILGNMLRFIYNINGKNYKNVPPKPLVDAEFIAFRYILRLIMDTPYDFHNDWCIHVTRFKGNFYLDQFETERVKNYRANKTDEQKTIHSWGYKFKQHCLTENPSQDPNTNLPVDQSAKFCCVYKTSLQGLKLLYGAVTDGVISETPINEDISTFNSLRFVKLKVSQHELDERQLTVFKRYKSRFWWCQCFLININDIYLGGRNDYGIVEKIHHVDVRSLPEQGRDYWTPTVCTNFLVEFLTCLKSLMQDVNCPYTVFEFFFHPQLSKITYKRLNGKTNHSFLPEWYINFLNNQFREK